MNSGIKAEWLAALRSDKYKQGSGRLHTDASGEHEYCCLGVLCEVIGVEKRRGGDGVYLYGGEGNFPHEYALHAVELTPDNARDLARMNDGVGYDRVGAKTFAEIADYIEEKY